MQFRDKDPRRKLTPDYDVGCKRRTLSHSYFRAFTKLDAHLKTDGIDHVDVEGTSWAHLTLDPPDSSGLSWSLNFDCEGQGLAVAVDVLPLYRS